MARRRRRRSAPRSRWWMLAAGVVAARWVMNRWKQPRQPLGAHLPLDGQRPDTRPYRPPAHHQPGDPEVDVVDRSAMDSFPASDPPSWTLGV